MNDLFPRVRTSTLRLDRRAASRDLWPGGTLRMWQGEDAPQPDQVFWPETDAEVGAVLAEAMAQGRVVVPYGAGSGVCGGARGRTGAWVIDTKGFDDIGEVDADTWTVEVGAGVVGQHLEDALNAQGYTLGHSPSSIWCSTVGGWAAARGAGQFSSKYGVFEDMVIGMDAVAPGTGPFHVGLAGASSASQRGDDAWFAQLLGSEGTLAVITRLRLRVRPLPAARWMRGYRFDDVPSALEAMRTLMQGELWPSVVRLYDPVDTLVGGRTKPKTVDADSHASWWRSWLAAIDELPEVRRRMLALPLSMPGVLRKVADGLASGCLLVVGWEGDPEVVEACASVGHDLLCARGTDLGEAPGQRWYASRHAVSYKLMPIFERGGFADTMEIAASWSTLPEVYAAVRDAVSEHAGIMAHMSHVYPEGGSIYFSFAGRGDREVYERTWKAAQDAVLASGATVTHHHGVGALKAPWASAEVGPAVTGWWALKGTLDPARILNPGRVFVDLADWPEPPPRRLEAGDGLFSVALDADADARTQAAADAGGEPRWPWASLPVPAPWLRDAWRTGWVEVRGDLGGVPCALGRGPRSASGPDLRPWLASRGEAVEVTLALACEGERWMGRAEVEAPLAVARALLRSDLRPSVLDTSDGVLTVGFRGPAAASLGALASARVPGGLRPMPWHLPLLPSGPLEVCDLDDPNAIAVTTEHALRPAEGAS